MADFNSVRQTGVASALRASTPQQSRGSVRDWLTVEEAAERTGFSKRTVYRAISAGDLKAYKRHRQWRIAPADVDAWVRGGDKIVRRHTPRRSPRVHDGNVSGNGFLAQHLQARQVGR